MRHASRRVLSALFVSVVVSSLAVPAALAGADVTAVPSKAGDGQTTGQGAPAPLAPAPPYSLPWLLRPVVPTTVVRVDETMAFYEGTTGGSGSTYVTSVIATYRLSPRWVPVVRAMWVKNDAPAGTASGSGFSNPAVGINYLRPLGGPWRLAGFLASTIPVGSGGGTNPDPGAAAAMSAGIPARSGMDNTLFAVNYWGLVGGVGVARVARGLTVQAEATVFQLTRVRGPETQDEHRTNFTAGLHVGHFFTRSFSIGAEVRLQRWLTDAGPVRADEAAREQLTFGFGPRFHFRAAGRTVRPGVSWSRAIDDPMARGGYDVVQVDVPVVF